MVILLEMFVGFVIGFGVAAYVGGGIIQDLHNEIDELREELDPAPPINPRPGSGARDAGDRPGA